VASLATQGWVAHIMLILDTFDLNTLALNTLGLAFVPNPFVSHTLDILA
jgi:hypothetical protein